MFYILYHSAELKGGIPKLNVVSKTLEGLLTLYNVTVGLIAAVYPQEGYRKKNGKMVQLSLRRGELSHHCRRVAPPQKYTSSPELTFCNLLVSVFWYFLFQKGVTHN